MIDGNEENYDKKKYDELARKHKLESYINYEEEDARMERWTELRYKECIPKTMKLV